MIETSNRAAHRRRAAGRGFTLLEVMIGLAVLGFGLTVLIKGAAGNIFNAQQAHLIGVATDLARGKMYDLEEKLLKDGFSDTEQHEEDQSFSDEGWPAIHYSYKIEVIELPSFDQLQALAKGQGSGAGSAGGSASGSAGSGSGAGSDDTGLGGFGNSVLGGFVSQFSGVFGGGGGGGGKGGADVSSAIGASFVQSQYTLFQQILKESVRKVTLTLSWQVLGSDRDMKVVAFFTDAGAMDKVLNGAGSQELPDDKNQTPQGGGGNPPANKPPVKPQ